MAAVCVPTVTDGVATGAALSSAPEQEIANDAMAIATSRDARLRGIGQGMITRNSCYSWAGFRPNGLGRARDGGNEGPHRIRRGGGCDVEGSELHARR